jgi:hypothetical protein
MLQKQDSTFAEIKAEKLSNSDFKGGWEDNMRERQT